MLLLKCCFTSTETAGLLGTGAQDGHVDFHTAPVLWKWFGLMFVPNNVNPIFDAIKPHIHGLNWSGLTNLTVTI